MRNKSEGRRRAELGRNVHAGLNTGIVEKCRKMGGTSQDTGRSGWDKVSRQSVCFATACPHLQAIKAHPPRRAFSSAIHIGINTEAPFPPMPNHCVSVSGWSCLTPFRDSQSDPNSHKILRFTARLIRTTPQKCPKCAN